MSKSMRAVVVGLSIASLSACSHLSLMSRDGSGGGFGEANGYGGSGTLSINLNGKPYTGSWTSLSGRSSSDTTGFVGATPVVMTTSTSGNSNGRALLRAPDGSGLRCDFVMNPTTFGATGFGTCQSDDGKLYDLQIR
jgi:hypothetical protein